MAKGGNYEREFSKKLSLWWTGGASDAVFWRTSNSGGRATVRANKGGSTLNQHGDICATDPIGDPLMQVVTFELKRGYSNNNLFNLVDKPKICVQQQWEEWIQKAERDHLAAGSFSWAIVARRDGKPEMIVMPRELADILFWEIIDADPPHPFFYLFVKVRFKIEGRLIARRMCLCGTLLNHLFEFGLKPEFFKYIDWNTGEVKRNA